MRGRSTPSPEGTRDGDFEVFFRREHPRLLSVAVAMVGDREVARELVQESLLRSFTAWSTVGGLERPGAWTRHVLVNLCIDVDRRKARERQAIALATPSRVVESPDPAASDVWRAVRSLPRLQRSVVALHYVDDLSVADVAQVLGVSTGSVKTSLSRARDSLAGTLHTNAPRKEQP